MNKTYQTKKSALAIAMLLGGIGCGVSAVAAPVAAANWNYFQAYNKTTGVPNTLSDMRGALPSDLISQILAKLPEGQSIFKNSETGLLADDFGANIFLVKDAQVSVAFVYSGAGYHNGLGYFKFNANAIPTATSQIQDSILFPSITSPIFNPSTSFLKYGNAINLGNFLAGDAIGFTLLSNGWMQGSGIDNPNQPANAIFRSIQELNPETNVGGINYKAHTVLLSDPASGLLVLGFEDLNRTRGQGSDDDFNDVVIAVKVTPFSAIETSQIHNLMPSNELNSIDTDKDTVPDYLDAFPLDPNRASQNFYPSATGYGKLAFEDQWPIKGDYDMNDVVVNYRIVETLNAAGQVTDLDTTYQLVARGGVYHRGLGLHLPGVSPDSIVKANADGTPAATLSINGQRAVPLTIEAKQPEAVLVFATDLTPLSAGAATYPCDYFNTWNQCPNLPGPRFVSHVTFTKPLANFPAMPFNPFIFSSINRGKETHLVDMPPTALADASLFGTGDDTSEPGKNRYYRTANNLPWALNIPDSWQYPSETQDITLPYATFGPWAESNGLQNPDWYLNPTNTKYLYQKSK